MRRCVRSTFGLDGVLKATTYCNLFCLEVWKLKLLFFWHRELLWERDRSYLGDQVEGGFTVQFFWNRAALTFMADSCFFEIALTSGTERLFVFKRGDI